MKNLLPVYDTFYNAMSAIWPMLLLFVVILIVMRLAKLIINKEKFVFHHDFYSLLFILYMLALYYLLLSTDNASAYGTNLIPFKEMTRYSIGSKGFVYNVLGNIALFIPFGFFVSYYIKAKKTHQICIIAFITSLTAELIQYKIGRAFDVDDIILNIMGAIIGFLAYIGIDFLREKLPNQMKNDFFYNILAIFVLIIIIVLFYFMWRNS